MINKPMNEKQERFCVEYSLNGGNASQAALAAGYSPRTAAAQGARLLKNVEIRQYIDNLKKPQNEEMLSRIADRDELLAGLTSIIRGEPQPFNVTGKVWLDSVKLLGDHLGLWKASGVEDTSDSDLMLLEAPESEEKDKTKIAIEAAFDMLASVINDKNANRADKIRAAKTLLDFKSEGVIKEAPKKDALIEAIRATIGTGADADIPA